MYCLFLKDAFASMKWTINLFKKNSRWHSTALKVAEGGVCFKVWEINYGVIFTSSYEEMFKIDWALFLESVSVLGSRQDQKKFSNRNKKNFFFLIRFESHFPASRSILGCVFRWIIQTKKYYKALEQSIPTNTQ